MRRVFVGFRFIVTLTCFAAWQNVSGSTLRGILYGDQGGVSGTATGSVRLAVDGQVYRLAYQKPYPQVFSSEDCRFAGASWTVVTTEIDVAGQGYLTRAKSNGDGDAI